MFYNRKKKIPYLNDVSNSPSNVFYEFKLIFDEPQRKEKNSGSLTCKKFFFFFLLLSLSLSFLFFFLFFLFLFSVAVVKNVSIDFLMTFLFSLSLSNKKEAKKKDVKLPRVKGISFFYTYNKTRKSRKFFFFL